MHGRVKASAAILTREFLPAIEGLPEGSSIILIGDDSSALEARCLGLHLRDALGVFLPGPRFVIASLLRKPTAHVVESVYLMGTGALNIDGTRVPGVAAVPWGKIRAYRVFDDQSKDGPALKAPPPPHPLGRWPTNAVLVHSSSCVKKGPCASDCPVSQFDRQSPASEEAPSRIFPHFYSIQELFDWFRRLITPLGGECLTLGI